MVAAYFSRTNQKKHPRDAFSISVAASPTSQIHNHCTPDEGRAVLMVQSLCMNLHTLL
jgi:hypothetical protein